MKPHPVHDDARWRGQARAEAFRVLCAVAAVLFGSTLLSLLALMVRP